VSELILSVRAPSNIALMKYMGKKDSSMNLPENPSLSMTLNSLCSVVEVTVESSGNHQTVRWLPELPQKFLENLPARYPLIVPALDDRAVGKMIRHFERVEKAVPEIFSRWGLNLRTGGSKGKVFTFRSANTFPASSGIASSASSFAALTLGMATALCDDGVRFQKIWETEPALRRALARVARQGSGSACRSFEGPWVLWDEQDATKVETQSIPALAHFVILVKTDPKQVSSSDAHLRIKTSPLWEGRPERVRQRTGALADALKRGDLEAISRLSWSEAWEMHSLFHTCSEPFSYWEPGTMEVLQWFARYFKQNQDFPIVTLDAGPNIHVIVVKSQREIWRRRIQEQWGGTGLLTALLEDEPGEGASLIGINGK